LADIDKKAAQDQKEDSMPETEKDPKVEAKPAAETEEKKAENNTKESSKDDKEKTSGSAEKAEETGKGEKAEDAGDQKKSFFKKKEKKDPKDEKIADMTDRLQRQMAEFDNYRKRTEKEKAQMFDIGAKSVIEKILPIVDNFERGLENCDENDPFAEGMKKTYKQLTTMLTDLDVKPIEAVGKEFDPNFHNAVMHTEDESVGENTIVEEFQKGYLYKDTVVRHSMVKVAN
jgi:molecular chaperone GrpE